MKALLKDLLTLTAPIAGETLILYLAVSKEAVSSILVVERGDAQMPIYFVSKAFSRSELNYLPIEKLPEISGRLTKWAIELDEHEIAYCARSAIKGQVMANYLAETVADMPVICDPEQLLASSPKLWELYTDGASSSEGAGAGLVLTGPHREEHTYESRFNFKVTNNEAEYEALLAGMRIARELGVKKLQAYVDSQLVANQIIVTLDANDKSMQSYLALVHSLADTFVDFIISQIPRSQNKQVDVLNTLAALTFNHLEKKILVEQVFKKSTEPETTVASVEEEEATWKTEIIEFLRTGSLPKGEKEAMKIRVKAPNYELRGEILY
ncbi:uncharacterized protein [Rutidosis leptorrhynchoides]|uniref:uncharacterized protein n=1 Tax=Rutidosis leptorrhynchoides TaxID=125765 RepID=UPI003A99288F